MPNEIEQRQFVDQAGLEQFWSDVQLYLTRNYKELPTGMQFSRVYQKDGQLHVLVEPFGGSSPAGKAASRTSLDVYSKGEVQSIVADNGTYIGQKTVEEVNEIGAEDLHNGDHVNVSDEGDLVNHDDPVTYTHVTAGDNAIYDGTLCKWDRIVGDYKTRQTAVSESFESDQIILDISQDENGDLAVTKQRIPHAQVGQFGLTTLKAAIAANEADVDSAATPKAVRDAINALDAEAVQVSALETVASISERDGVISVSKQAIQEGTVSQKGVVQLKGSVAAQEVENDRAVTPKAVRDTINALNATVVSGMDAHMTVRDITETAGLVSVVTQQVKVAAQNIDDGAVTEAKIGDGAVTTEKLADGAVSVDQIADGTITGAKIAQNTITGRNIATGNNDGITTANIVDHAITNQKLSTDSVDTAQLVDGSVTTDKILNSSVTSDKIADGSVTTGKIANSGVTTDKIANGNVTTEKLGNSSVTTAKLADSNVTTAKIADGNVTTEKIADDAVTTEKILDGNVTTAKLADDAVTTAKILDKNVTTAKIADDAVTTVKIADGNVTTAKLADDAVTTAKILDGNVTNAKMATDSVGTSNIINGNVTTAKIADGNVTTAKIADSNVTTAKIADANVTHAKMANDSVGTSNIIDESVTNSKIDAGAVTYDKVSRTEGHPFDIDISGNAATASDAEPESALDNRISDIEDDVDALQANKADKVANAVAGNFASLNASGNLVDSGKNAASFMTALQAPYSENGTTVQTVTSVTQATTGAIAVTYSDIRTATTSVTGITQLKSDLVSQAHALSNDETKAVTSLGVKSAIANLDVGDTAASNEFVTSVGVNADRLVISRARPSVSNVSGLEDALTLKADRDLDAVEGNLAVFDANGHPVDSGNAPSHYKTVQGAVSDPSSAGNALDFIDTISQDANGEITATKKRVGMAVAAGEVDETDGLLSKEDKKKLDDIPGVEDISDNDSILVGDANGTVEWEAMGTDQATGKWNSFRGHGFFADRSVADRNGNTIDTTYATKTELSNTVDGLDATVTSESTTNLRVQVVEADGLITGVNVLDDNTENVGNKVTSWSNETTDTNYPSEKLTKDSLDLKADRDLDAVEGNLAVFDSNGHPVDSGTAPSHYKTVQTAKSDPGASGSGLTYIATITQDANGEITATKRTVQDATDAQKGVVQLATSVGATVASENNKAATEKAVRDAINALDVNSVGGEGKYIKSISEADGKIVPVEETADANLDTPSTKLITSQAVDNAFKAMDATVTTTGTMLQLSVTQTDGILTSIDILHDNAEDVNNKAQTLDVNSTTDYPSSKAVADFVNSSISTNTANYISNNGEPFTSVAQLEAYSGQVTNNDYAFVTDAHNTYYDRYKASVDSSTTPATVTWAKEYRLNNSAFTAEQWAAINSTVNSTKVSGYDAHLSNTSNPHQVTKAQVGLDLVNNSAITVTSTSVSTRTHNSSTGTDETVTFNQYVHPTGTGYNHVPSGGSAGQFLGWSSDGSAAWTNNPNTDHMVTQNDVTGQNGATDEYPILLKNGANGTDETAEVNYDASITVNPSTGTVTATTFAGDLSGNAATASAAESGSALETALNSKAAGDHVHGSISNDGKIGSASGLSVVTGTDGAVTVSDLTTASPSVPSQGTTTAFSFIDTVSQDSMGKISATKKAVQGASGSQDGLMSSSDYTKLSGISTGATKTETSGTNGNIKIDGVETTVYTHPTTTAATAAAIKVGRDAEGHVVLGTALAKGDVGLGNVDNTSDATKKSDFTGSIAENDTGFVLGGDAYDALETKANKSEMSVTPGTGSDSDKTTIQLKSGTTATVLTSHQSVSGKADKVTGATSGNFASLDANGNIADSGSSASSFMNALSTAYSVAGSSTQTVTAVSQATTGEISVTFGDIQTGTTAQPGLVQLENSTSSTSTTKAATPASVKSAYDLADSKYTLPATGIPDTDLSAEVQASLALADGSIQGISLNGSSVSPDSSGVVNLGNLKTRQTAVADPTASGTTLTAIATLSQDANGVITATKKTIQSASATQAGVMSSSDFSKLAGISEGATKAEASSTNGNIVIDDTETTVYAHPAGSAASVTGVPTANAAPGFGGTFKVNQVTTDATSHVSAITERTITIPNATATGSAAGLMSAADKTKLDGIATGAEVNQNAFSNIAVGETTVAAATKTDTVTFVAGSNVTITPDASEGTVTFAATDTTYTAGDGIKLETGVFKHTNSVSPGTVGATTSTSGSTFEIPYVTYDSQGHITATGVRSHSVGSASTSGAGVVQLAGSIGATVSTENNKAASEKAVRDAINALDADVTSSNGTNLQVEVVETDGKVSGVSITDNTASAAQGAKADSALQGITVNGASVTPSSNVADIPAATSSSYGVVTFTLRTFSE